MRVLIVGLGSIGMRHARNLKTLGVEDMVGVDPTADRRARFSSELGYPAHEELAVALGRGIDIAFICSPNVHHVSQAIECARAECHLFIEKPIGVSRDRLDELLDLVNSKNLYAHVGSNWKFHRSFQVMKQLLDTGAIGRVTAAQVLAGQWLPDWHPWEDYRHGYSARRDLGGGIVFDSHELDYITWLLGPVVSLKGFTTRTGVIEIETEDVACACLRFECGALATVQLDYIQRQTRRRYHISGDQGTIEWDIHDGRVRHYRPGASEARDTATPLGDVNEMYLEQTREVLDAIAARRAPVTPIRHAVQALELQLELIQGHA